MSVCENGLPWIPKEEGKEWHVIWLNCGHYEHLECWKAYVQNRDPKCFNCKRRFPVVVMKGRATTKTSMDAFKKHDRDIKRKLALPPRKLEMERKGLDKYRDIQYPLKEMHVDSMVESHVPELLRLGCWKELLDSRRIVLDYRRLLLEMVIQGDEDSAKQLIPHVGDINTSFDLGWGYLHHAVFNGQRGMVRLLVAGGADVNKRSRRGLTPLHYAYRYGMQELVEALLKLGANRHIKDEYGLKPIPWTPETASYGRDHLSYCEGEPDPDSLDDLHNVFKHFEIPYEAGASQEELCRALEAAAERYRARYTPEQIRDMCINEEDMIDLEAMEERPRFRVTRIPPEREGERTHCYDVRELNRFLVSTGCRIVDDALEGNCVDPLRKPLLVYPEFVKEVLNHKDPVGKDDEFEKYVRR